MSEENLTEWDSSKATLYRIDSILKACAEAAFRRDFKAWLLNLEVLKREAFVKMKPEVQKECARKFASLRLEVEKYTRNRPSVASEMFLSRSLDDAELFLRQFMDGKGMLMRESKGAMDRFRGG